MNRRALLGVVLAVPAFATEPVLVPIGADYGSVGEFAKVVIANATGPSVDIAVLPSAYDEKKEKAIANGDYDLALEHVAELQTACNAIVNLQQFPSGCAVSLVDLWKKPDANDAPVVAALNAADGTFILGGDQAAAMKAIAGTKAERAMETSYWRGGVLGGTSAGCAVQSKVMNNGYTDYGDTSVALQLGAIDVWFGDSESTRGLSFGSTRAVFEQHLYERGRFGRFLNLVAQTGSRLGHGGLIGVGSDIDTAGVVRNDQRISSVFGPTSISIVDFKTLNTSWAWVGTDGLPVPSPSPTSTPTAALSARNVLAHVLAPKANAAGNSRISYDFSNRRPTLNGQQVSAPCTPGSSGNAMTSSTPLILGGDLSVGPNWPGDSAVLRSFIAAARPTGNVLIVTVGYERAKDAQDDIDAYTSSLVASGFTGTIVGKKNWENVTDNQLNNSAGVIMLAADQGALPGLMANPAFGTLVRSAKQRSGVLMLDRSMAALAGDIYDGIPDLADWIASFTSAQANIQPGLGLVNAQGQVAFETRLQYDYKHGRLFGVPNARRNSRPTTWGISEGTAVVITNSGATVVGANPVWRVDTKEATFYDGDNGAFGVLNAIIDVFEPRQRLTGH